MSQATPPKATGSSPREVLADICIALLFFVMGIRVVAEGLPRMR